MAKGSMKSADRVALKMTRETVERVRAISEVAARQGWASLGVDRDDPATMTAVVEAAVDVLYARAFSKRK